MESVKFINQDLYPGEFALHQKYAKSEMLLNLVWTHSIIIAEITQSLLDSGKFDTNELPRDLVTQAALLFDIGVYICGGFEFLPGQPPSDKPYIQHTIAGAWILRKEGYTPPVVQVAYVHTGVGITSQDIVNYGLQLPMDEYMPRTEMQKLITYTSKFHSKAPKFKTVDMIIEALDRHGHEKVERFKELQEQFGLPEIEPIAQKYDEWQKWFQFELGQLKQQPSTAMLNTAGIAQ